MVGTHVTGLQMQITHGSNGYLVDDTEGEAVYTLQLLQDRSLWRELGSNAYETVRRRFLFPALSLDYLKALQRALAGTTVGVKPESVPDTLSATGKGQAA